MPNLPGGPSALAAPPVVVLPPPKHIVYRVMFNGICEGSKIQNVFWYEDDSLPAPPTVVNFQALMYAITQPTTLVAKYIAACSSDYHLTNIVIDDPMHPEVLGDVELFNSMGGAIDKTNSLNVAVVISRYTAIRHRRGRGRVRIPAVPITWGTRSYLTNTTAHQALADEMLKIYTQGGQTFYPGLYSPWQYEKGNPVPVAEDSFNQLSGTVLQPRFGSMRRRMPPDPQGP